MASIRWLHLTDFHQGMGDQDWLWPNVKEQFFDDLKKIHERSGPWDLVFFTGDLTQRGSESDFKALEATLEEIWEKFQELGSTPGMVVVPGNHDLLRPPNCPTLKALKLWKDDIDIQKEFWNTEGNPYLTLIKDAFGPFQEWWKKSKFNNLRHNHGIVPGDFSTTFEKDGFKFGIVGLNTSFLQLTGDNYEGKLFVSSRQFHSVCQNDGPKWVNQHHTCILLTHHPVEWLDVESRKDFLAEIYPPGRFVMHLCGHMHDTKCLTMGQGGAKPRITLVGSSLFGLEKWNNGVQRFHGYNVGGIDASDNTNAQLIIWPRLRKLNRGSDHYRILADNDNFELTTPDESTIFQFELTQPLTPTSNSGAPTNRDVKENFSNPQTEKKNLYLR
jgi:predicted MPP superfamily phosphohydrolase